MPDEVVKQSDNIQSTESDIARPSPRAGFFFALTAYSLWGSLPLFFRAAGHLDPFELVVHRIVWALPFALAVMAVMGRLKEIPGLIRDRRIMAMMCFTSTLIAANWLIYVWAISVDRTTETALGYYINPLITVLLGATLLGETPNRMQALALTLAALAVVIRVLDVGGFPWIPLSLAISFALYGYVRKTVPVGPTQGFVLEVMLLFPVGIAAWIWLGITGGNHFGVTAYDTFLLLMCGPVTAVPLILYAFGAKGLRLTTLGLMQYLAPTLIFLIAVFLFEEPLSFTQLVSFILVWTALAIYTYSIFRSPH